MAPDPSRIRLSTEDLVYRLHSPYYFDWRKRFGFLCMNDIGITLEEASCAIKTLGSTDLIPGATFEKILSTRDRVGLVTITKNDLRESIQAIARPPQLTRWQRVLHWLRYKASR